MEGAADAIYVMFYDGSVYRHEASRIGDGALGEMIRLGEGNSGLVRFIHAHVKYDYSWFSGGSFAGVGYTPFTYLQSCLHSHK